MKHARQRTWDLLVFDLDGTLVDSTQDIHRALWIALSQVTQGKEGDAEDAAFEAGCHGLPLHVFFQRARPRASKETLDALAMAYRHFYYEHLLDTTKPFAGVREGLAALQGFRKDGLRLAVATTKMTATATKVLSGLGLSESFDVILGSDGLPAKPDPAVLFSVFRALQLDPQSPSGVMIGDTEMDIQAGRAAGLATCVVGWSEVEKERLFFAKPDHHIDDFGQLLEMLDMEIPKRPASMSHPAVKGSLRELG